MSQDEMAAQLGVAKRTIANWHERPDIAIRAELQRALDTAYERAPDAAKIRFARQLSATTRPKSRRPARPSSSPSRSLSS